MSGKPDMGHVVEGATATKHRWPCITPTDAHHSNPYLAAGWRRSGCHTRTSRGLKIPHSSILLPYKGGGGSHRRTRACGRRGRRMAKGSSAERAKPEERAIAESQSPQASSTSSASPPHTASDKVSNQASHKTPDERADESSDQSGTRCTKMCQNHS